MGFAKIELTLESSADENCDDIAVVTRYMEESSELDPIVDAWAKQAMLYSKQLSESMIDESNELWHMDEGATIYIQNGGYQNVDYDALPIFDTTNDMQIRILLDVGENAYRIGGMSTPTAKSALMLTQMLKTAMKRVEV